jgi:hypothetical protein
VWLWAGGGERGDGAGLDDGFVILYQTLLANGPSVALATRLGYRPYATSLAVRLSPEGA